MRRPCPCSTPPPSTPPPFPTFTWHDGSRSTHYPVPPLPHPDRPCCCHLLAAAAPCCAQIDPDVAFCSRLRRLDLDLVTGVLRMRTAFDEYLEMVGINEGYQVRPTVLRCAGGVHGCGVEWVWSGVGRALKGVTAA